MRIGYACQTIGVPGTDYRGCVMKSATEERLLALIKHNLQSLDRAIDYNISSSIRLFRITSDLIPFGSSPVNQLSWPSIFAQDLAAIGEKIRRADLRVSMHPGQYTVLNSPDPDIVRRAADDLLYHHRVLDGLGLDSRHKIILHAGGAYGSKPDAAERFVSAWRCLDPAIRSRVIIENDERNYNIADVLAICGRVGAPAVFDNLHHALNPSDPARTPAFWIEACRETWAEKDGVQKIHYSQQDPGGRPGAHTRTIRAAQFLEFLSGLGGLEPDIMLEVKDKNLSARKCILCASLEPRARGLENEWRHYKYKVLENSPASYQAVRTLFREKAFSDAIAFYDQIDRAMDSPPSVGSAENTALHLWGYFKKTASELEKQSFFGKLDRFRAGKTSIAPVKQDLLDLVNQYHQDYLVSSYYFYL